MSPFWEKHKPNLRHLNVEINKKKKINVYVKTILSKESKWWSALI